MEKIIIYGTERRAAMYFGYLKSRYDVRGFISTNSASGAIFEVSIWSLTDLFLEDDGERSNTGRCPDYDRIVLAVETDQMEKAMESISEAAGSSWDDTEKRVISIDGLIKENAMDRPVTNKSKVSPYVEYIDHTQIEIIKEILEASDEEVGDFEWMLDKVTRYGLFCFESNDWYKKSKQYNWVVYGLQQIPEEFARFCNYLVGCKIDTAMEIGVYRGRSAFFLCAILARKNKNLTYKLVDIFDRIDDFDLFKEVLPQLEKCIPSSSDDYKNQHFDFVFIDADHSYDASINDYNNVGQYSDSLVAFHDIYAHEYDHENGGTVRMWQEVLDRTFEYEHKIFSVYPDKWMGIGCVVKKSNTKKYYIFGAHSRGQTMAVYLKRLYPSWKCLGYLVDNDESNSAEIEGIPVIDLRCGDALDTDACTYIATRSTYHEHIIGTLRQAGIKDIVPVDVTLDNKLRNSFVKEYSEELGRHFDKIEGFLVEYKGLELDPEKRAVYVVKSAADAGLDNEVDLSIYEKYIQAGKALTETSLDGCDCFDDIGDNISLQNRQMCELTAMYWIWKNAKQQIIGIEHYRRRFILPMGWEEIFFQSQADVILPVPLYVRPSIKENYVGRHIEKMWASMIRNLKNLYGEEEARSAVVFFDNTGCYSPCNMLVARKEVFDELCEWLFPILFSVVEECGEVADKYQNRYPGFLSERLISFFFLKNQDRFKVVYADKVFLK